MNQLPPDILDRLYELLGERQCGTLTDAQATELEGLLADAAGKAAEADFERTQAALLMAFVDAAPARMPADSRARLQAIGEGMTAKSSGSARGGMGPMLGWAAAALLAIVAAVGWFREPATKTVVVTPPVVTPPREPSIGEKLAMLLQDPATATVTLAAQKEPAVQGATAQAIWNNQLQQGYLRLKGVAANDPSKEQYQLWIFDADRETYPIDGGVFDVSQAAVDPATGDTIIPMRPSLRVGKPAAIAVTLEQPGGVVVTDKSRLALLGAVN